MQINSNSADWWLKQVEAAEKFYQPYFDLVDETRDNYKLEKKAVLSRLKSSTANNIFWAGIETLKPFLYFKQPRPCIARVNKNSSPVENLACQLLERVLCWDLSKFDFDSVIKYARNDFLISGCGILWEVYKPEFTTVLDENGRELLIKTDEKVISEYVNPKNFLADFENVGIWEDVNWVARIHYLCRKSIFESFGEEKALAVLGPSVPDDDYKQIKVYEIWDKVSKCVLWVCQNNANLFLKEIENPLGVEGFFPCPKPIFATLANGSIIPVPDYAMIKADIEELGGVVDRMSLTMKALKVTGAYDSSFPHLADILNKDVSLVAVQDFDKLKNAGGIKGIVDFMPIEQYISALQALAARRDDIIENIYRVTGISDIMRGTSNPDDTATAVKQKTNFGTLRNQDRQNDMQRFICDLYRLKAEIICEQFSTDNLASFLTAEERQNQALVQAAIRLLKTDKMRDMVLSVETDAVFNQAAEEAKVVSTVETVHKLIQGAFQLVSLQPKLLPMYQKMIAAVVASMPNARGFESVVENCFAQIKSELEVETPSLSAQDVKVSQSLPEAAYQSQQLSVDDQLKMMQIQNNYEIEKEKNALKAREVALKENAEAAKISLSNKELNLQAQEQKLKADEKAKL